MNYAYTSARVRALENSLPSQELITALVDCETIGECVTLLNGEGFDGSSAAEIIAGMKLRKDEFVGELIDDIKEIEVIFYPKAFHNLKAAAKKLYSKSRIDFFYRDAPVSGETIMTALQNGDTASLPDYLSSAARETYSVIMHTGDGRLSDMTADKACLEAMAEFGKRTKHEILKIYVNETIAAADIKLALRAGNSPNLLEYLVPCSYFSTEALIRALNDSSIDEFLASAGFDGITAANADAFSEKRISSLLSREKYNIFSPAPAINFIIEFDRAVSSIRYILICKQNGIDKEKISERMSYYV
jgi:V/A-type H+-transporting ATPase subunit C